MIFQSICQDGSGGPIGNTTLIGPSLKHQIAIDAPLRSPTIFDEPVIFLLGAVAHQHKGVVRPGGTPEGTGHSTLVVEQASEVQADG